MKKKIAAFAMAAMLTMTTAMGVSASMMNSLILSRIQ